MDRAFEGGIDFFDTADVYPLGGGLDTVGRTEEIVGRWLRDRGVRDRIVLATKCAGAMGPGPNDVGLSRYAHPRRRRREPAPPQTDFIDLYQVHAFDPRTPIEETLRALDDLVRWGKVRYVGCSNYPAVAARRGARRRASAWASRATTACSRATTSSTARSRRSCCRSARIQGLGVIVYNPLAGGFLSGKYRKGEDPLEGTRFTLGNAAELYQQRYWQDALFDAVDELRGAAESRGVSLATVAVAWAIAQPGITSAIVGASRPEQLDASLAARDVQIDEGLTRRLRRRLVVAPAPPRPRGLSMTTTLAAVVATLTSWTLRPGPMTRARNRFRPMPSSPWRMLKRWSNRLVGASTNP